MYGLKQKYLAITLAAVLASSVAAIERNPADKTVSDGKGTAVERKERYGWFYGLVASASGSPYQGRNDGARALPIIGYKGRKFTWTGPRASYRLFKHKELTTTALLNYQLIGYEAGDSGVFSDMNRRYNAFFGGLETAYQHEKLSFNLAYSHDLQGRSNGSDARLGAAYAYNFGPLFITPNVGVTRFNSDYTNYYYGVRADEARPDRPTYRTSSTMNKVAGLSVATPIFFGGFSRLAITHTWLGNEVKNSPLIDDGQVWQATFTFSRFF